ncbi:MAG TPA: pyruvate dehydrogenase (acetyl-transferring) E1 component subunit alpha [Propionibacteriaceae bacterium]|nr:pyruvate dehydrogenase (acetyl-transferring) E1 component subunit alpha [Propionibacteriaceae bacterium]
MSTQPALDPNFLSSPTDMVQLLTPEGERVENADFRFDGDDAQIAGYLRDMVLARRLDIEATALQRQGELGLWPPLLGQEAAQIGAGRAVRATDMVFPTYREHAVAMTQGVDIGDILGLYRGTHLGHWDSIGKHFHNYTVVIGAQTLHATGYAMGMQRDGMVGNPDPDRNGAVLAFHGDGASSQGDVNEAYVFAASYNAPVVFFCQNNQWAISEPITRQTRIPLYQRALGFGFPGVRVDGNDVLAVKAVTDWALERARTGQGPAFIEAFTYRMGAHTTSDDPSKYRLAAETEHWKLKDPIERVRAYLMRHASLPASFFTDLDAEAEEFGASVRTTCRGLANPELSQIFDAVYAEQTPLLAEQKDEYLTYASTFEPGVVA